jgi:hypothetical protein
MDFELKSDFYGLGGGKSSLRREEEAFVHFYLAHLQRHIKNRPEWAGRTQTGEPEFDEFAPF